LPRVLNVSRFDITRIRALRRFKQADRRIQEGDRLAARVVNVASGKGGTGKSIIASNLAVLRARAGEKVLLIDFDAGMANAHLLLGLAPRHDLGDVQQGLVSAREALVEGPEGMRLLSGGVGRPALANPTRRELDRLYRALRPLENEFDLIVVDHGAGMSYATITQLAATSTLILVTNPEVTALSDSYALYKRTRAVNPGITAGLVVNRAPGQGAADAARARFESVSRRFLFDAPRFVAWVPHDEAVIASVHRRSPVCLSDPASPAAAALERVSRWEPIDRARTPRSFYDLARRALR